MKIAQRCSESKLVQVVTSYDKMRMNMYQWNLLAALSVEEDGTLRQPDVILLPRVVFRRGGVKMLVDGRRRIWVRNAISVVSAIPQPSGIMEFGIVEGEFWGHAKGGC
jgi:hypothetical protein